MDSTGIQLAHPAVQPNYERDAGPTQLTRDQFGQLHPSLGEAGPTATPFLYSQAVHAEADSASSDDLPKDSGFFARLICCCCSCTISTHPSATKKQQSRRRKHAAAPYGEAHGLPAYRAQPETAASSSTSDPTQPVTPIPLQLSLQSAIQQTVVHPIATMHSMGHRAIGLQDCSQQQQQRSVTLQVRRALSTAHSEAVTEWADAKSGFSGGTLDVGHDDLAGYDDTTHQMQQQDSGPVTRSLSVKLPWVPDPPLYFAERPLQFVPVPAVTGFAAYWENIPERTTPFPQPIDLMIKASWLAKRVHKSIPGIWIRETDTKVTVTGNPSFIPPGHRAYMERYDKTQQEELTWSPRRDMMLGHCSGRIYYAADGTMILRCRVWTWPGNKLQFITEDYAVLEDDGQVIVNKMFCLEVDTGRSTSQYMVGSRHERPPKNWV